MTISIKFIKKALIFIAALVVIAAIIIVALEINKLNSKNSNPTPETPGLETQTQTQTQTQLANPASTNCLKVGGNLVIQKRGDGGEYGLCYFEDNRACEEWALLRGECPLGGVKTTGFDTIDQKYCAWSGGKTLAEPNSICTFKDDSKCSTEEFYNGKCPLR